MSDISDHEVSPWSCCPECGEVWLKVICVLERGNWVQTDGGREVYTINMENAPKVGGYRTEDLECTRCSHVFTLKDVGFVLRDWGEEQGT
jgi:hypothetical protein